MLKDTALDAVKKAMLLTQRANLALAFGSARDNLNTEQLEAIAEEATAIISLANSIIEKAQNAQAEELEQ